MGKKLITFGCINNNFTRIIIYCNIDSICKKAKISSSSHQTLKPLKKTKPTQKQIMRTSPQNNKINKLKRKMETTPPPKINNNNVISNSSNSSSSGDEVEAEANMTTPLSEIVSECVQRWFEDALKEAKAGDVAMQVLVSQMYYHSYGIPNKDLRKANYWMTRASRVRSSAWNVSKKRPGYHASDSDSEDSP